MDNKTFDDRIRSLIDRASELFGRFIVLNERTARISLLVTSSIVAVSCLSVTAMSIRASGGYKFTDSTDNITQATTESITIPYDDPGEAAVDDTPATTADLTDCLTGDVLALGGISDINSADDVSEETIKKTPAKDLNDKQITKMLAGSAGKVKIIDRKDIKEGAQSSGSKEDIGNSQAENNAVSDNSGVTKTFDSNNNYVIGIDVSAWNGNINWTKVKDYGVKFVIVRCGGRYTGSGEVFKDKNFEKNVKGAAAAGLNVGAYFYSAATSISEAYEEASYAVDLCKGLKINYPLAIDFEINSSTARHAGVKGKDLRDILKTFCDTVKSQGYTPMVYMSKSCWTSVLGTTYASEITSKYKVWLAVYFKRFISGTEPYKMGDPLPTFGYRYNIWQYGYLHNVIPGISGDVDCNLGFFSSASLVEPSITVPGGELRTAAGSTIDPLANVKAVNSLNQEVSSANVSYTIKNAKGYSVELKNACSTIGTYTVTYSFGDAYRGTVSQQIKLYVTDKASAPATAAAPTSAPATSAPSESVPSAAPSATAAPTATAAPASATATAKPTLKPTAEPTSKPDTTSPSVIDNDIIV